MSTDKLVKGECRHCIGHFKFPARLIGRVELCPHCGMPTTLAVGVSTQKYRWLFRLMKRIGFHAAIFLMGMGAGIFLVKHRHPIAATTSITASLKVSGIPVARIAEEGMRTNEFLIGSIALKKTPGSSLVYATGNIRNVSPRQRFGIRLELGLFDAQGRLIGKGKDYQSSLGPGAEWQFKVLVLDSKTASARLSSLSED